MDHLVFEYPGIRLPPLLLELSLCVKQAVGLTYTSAQGKIEAGLNWICSKPVKCIVVTMDFPKGIPKGVKGQKREVRIGS